MIELATTVPIQQSADVQVTANAKVGFKTDAENRLSASHSVTQAVKEDAEKRVDEQKKEQPPAEFGKMLAELDTYVQKFKRELQFLKDQDNGQLVIKVVNRDTNEVIRQIPSEEIQALHKRLEEAAGILIKVKA